MRFFQIEWKMSVPNALSLGRIAVLPLFVWLYMTGREYWAFVVLMLSGLSDLFDGMIARRLNQVTELGKLLDPVADKLTQVTVLVCVTIRYYSQYQAVIYLLVICVIKEACQALGGLILLHRGAEVRSARWYGKVSTFVFYGAMTILVLWTDMPWWMLYVLLGAVALLMLFAFFRYMRDFFNIRKETPRVADPSVEEGNGQALT